MDETSIEDQKLLTNHYDYELPKALIAQEPLTNREDARLMEVCRSENAVRHHHVRDLDELLRDGDCLVVNNTRVIPAKLVGFRSLTGGRWQGLFLEADENGNWRMLCKTRGNLKPGETVGLQDREANESLTLRMLSRLDDGSWVGRPEEEGDWTDLLKKIGRVPLPNYIRGGNMTDADKRDYQTVYAKHPGAVAAPTAGLHLTEGLIRRLIDRGVRIAQVTLHVGIGTFRPVKADHLGEHDMHFERGSIDEKSVKIIQDTRQAGGRVIGVGTTSVRLLETAASDGQLKPWSGETNLFIKPPYKFNVIDAMLTNFHLPRSTLLVMIRTFGGDALLTEAYRQAVEEKYRFYSYGDAMLIT